MTALALCSKDIDANRQPIERRRGGDERAQSTVVKRQGGNRDVFNFDFFVGGRGRFSIDGRHWANKPLQQIDCVNGLVHQSAPPPSIAHVRAIHRCRNTVACATISPRQWRE